MPNPWHSRIFWGGMLIIFGLVLLLDTLGVFAGLNFSLWGVLWPVAMMAAGVWLLWVSWQSRQWQQQSEPLSIPLPQAARARLQIKHGAGRVKVDAEAAAGALLDGVFGGGVQHKFQHIGEVFEAELKVPSQNVAWTWGADHGFDWQVHLAQQIPLELDVEMGANECDLHLTHLNLQRLMLKTGASTTSVYLPQAAGFTQVKVDAGACTLSLHVPQGVAARIRTEGGLATFNIDSTRFPKVGEIYESPDFGSAANRVEIELDGGLMTVSVN